MQRVKLKDIESGDVIERLPLDAKEIIAANGGRYVRLEDYKPETEGAPAEAAVTEVKPVRRTKP